MSVMIQLLNLKGMIVGLPIDDANMNVMNFVRICSSFNLPRVSQEILLIKLFPFSLKGK